MSRSLAVVFSLVAVLSACGDDNGTGPDGDGGNAMTATVDGANFAPPSLAVQGSLTQGVLSIAGSHTNGSNTTMISIILTDVDGTGTYQLSPNFAGQFAQVTKTQGSVATTASWSTILAPGSGTVNITTFTESRIAGNFNFTGQASPGTTATGQSTVTSGTFDLDI